MKSSAKVKESLGKAGESPSEVRGTVKLSRPRIGFHAPIAGGLQNALLKAHSLGADAVQIFSRNPRGWKARPLDAEEVEAFKRVRAGTGVAPVAVHANYLIN